MLLSPTKEDYARECARELLSSLPSLPCPVLLEPLAEARGIKRIARIKLDSDGFLFDDGANLIIYVNSQLSNPRYRFTCAHEIGHTYFKKPPVSMSSSVSRQNSLGCRTEFAERGAEEEYLCDIFAVELLMPSALARVIVDREGPSFRCIHQLASAFHVSISAAAWCLSELVKANVGIIWFKPMAKPSDANDIKLRLAWGVFPRRSRTYLPRFDAVPQDSLISKCFTSQQTLEGFEKLNFGSVRGVQYLACKRFGKSVLCLVFPEPPQSRQSSHYPMSLPI
ncbi:hypothetical protein ES703_46669 [subsurface metagenome]